MNRQQMVAPFAEEELHSFQGRGGQTMTYIEDETVMDRLDLGFGFGNWQVQVDAVSESVVKVRLGVREHGEWIWYEDFGYPNREGGESLKEAVSDGIRRAGRFVGIARDLYRKAPDERRTDTDRRPNAGTEAERGGAEPVTPPNVETEELMADTPKRSGMVRVGGAAGYKLEARQGPTGHVIGFRFETDKGEVPQVLVEGPAGEALFLATSQIPEALKDTRIALKGRLYAVKKPGRKSYTRLKVSEWEWSDWKFPAEGEPVLDEPPASIELFGEKTGSAA